MIKIESESPFMLLGYDHTIDALFIGDETLERFCELDGPSNPDLPEHCRHTPFIKLMLGYVYAKAYLMTRDHSFAIEFLAEVEREEFFERCIQLYNVRSPELIL